MIFLLILRAHNVAAQWETAVRATSSLALAAVGTGNTK